MNSWNKDTQELGFLTFNYSGSSKIQKKIIPNIKPPFFCHLEKIEMNSNIFLKQNNLVVDDIQRLEEHSTLMRAFLPKAPIFQTFTHSFFLTGVISLNFNSTNGKIIKRVFTNTDN